MVQTEAIPTQSAIRTPLSRLIVTGLRSFRDPQEITFSPVTLLAGPNGSGKSNLLGALTLLAHLSSESLGLYVRRSGGANALLHRGASVTRSMTLRASFGEGERLVYQATLEYASGDTLFFADERVRESGQDWLDLGRAQSESALPRSRAPAARHVLAALERIKHFHVHDTSPTSCLRQSSREEDNRYLRSDGSNLAAFLLALQQAPPESDAGRASERISDVVRQTVPGLKRLLPTLDPVLRTVRLDFIDDQDDTYGVHYLSDGSLRLLALVTALCQPITSLPWLVAIDEPELGLHPAALTALMGIIRSISHRCHVLLATHAYGLLSQVDLDEIVVVERSFGRTRLVRPDRYNLARWLAPDPPPRHREIDPAPLRMLLDRLVKALDPVAIWLFGSRARGDFREDSDWDLLVVVSEEMAESDAVHPLRVWELKQGVGIYTDVVVCSEGDFRDDSTIPNTLVYNVVHEGILLMSTERQIASLLSIAAGDLRDSRSLGEGSRNKIYLCAQAAEKVIKAVLFSEKLTVPRAQMHQLSEMVALVPNDNPHKELLNSLTPLTSYGTAFRYPTEGKNAGKIKPPPSHEEFERYAASVEKALGLVSAAFEVDLSDPNKPAGNANPIR